MKETILKIKPVAIVVTFAVIIGILVLNFYLSLGTYAKLNSTVKKTVEVEMENMLGNYTPEIAIKTLEQSTIEDIEAGILENMEYITDEDKKAIIEGVLSALTPQLIEKLSSSEELVRQQVLNSLEEEIKSKVTSVFTTEKENLKEEITKETIITEEEKKILTDSVVSVVESQLLTILNQSDVVKKETLTELEKRVQTNVSNLESSLSEYKSKIENIKTEINELEKKISNNTSGKNEDLQKQLNDLKKTCDDLVKEYSLYSSNVLMVSNIITNITTKPTGANQVLSAEAGYAIAEQLNVLEENTVNDLQTMGVDVNNLAVGLSELEEKTTDNLEEITRQKATLQNLTNTSTALEAAIEATRVNLSESITDTSNAIITSANINSKVNSAITAIDTALAANTDQATETNLNTIKQKLEDIDPNTADVEAVQEVLDEAAAALAVIQNTVSNNISSIEGNIMSLENSITSISGKVSNLELEMIDNTQELQAALANKQSKEEAAAQLTNMQQSLTDAKTELETLINTETSSLTEKITNAETSLSVLDAAIEQANQNNETVSADLISAREQLQQAINNAKNSAEADLSEAESNLADAISNASTSLQNNINTISDELTTTKQEVEEAQEEIGNLNNTITNVNQNISNLENKMPEYSFSTDGDKTTVTITIPAN